MKKYRAAIAIAGMTFMLAPCVAAERSVSAAARNLPPVHEKFLSSLRTLAHNPRSITGERLKALFPGQYKNEDCPDTYQACSFTSWPTAPVALRVFQLNNPRARSAFSASLHFEIAESPCLKQEAVDSYLGQRAGKPSVQPPWTFVREEEVIPFQMEYPHLKTADTTVYITIILMRECVTSLTMYVHPSD